MSYIQDSLGANEKIHYIAHFHWTRYALAYGALLLGVILSILTYDSAFPVLAIWPVLIGAVLFVAQMIPLWTTEIGVTDQRIIYKRGLFNRVTEELQLRSIEEVGLRQNIIGRIMDWGKLDIHGTGDDEILLPTIGDPVGARRALQEALGEAQQDAPAVGAGAMAQQRA